MREASRAQQPLQVHLTLRQVPILDELVYMVRDRIEGLAQATHACGTCDVEVRGHWWRGERLFAADLQLSDGVHEIRICEIRRDLFGAIEAAFQVLRRRLALEVQTGEWEVIELENPDAEDEDGWQPIRRRSGTTATP